MAKKISEDVFTANFKISREDWEDLKKAAEKVNSTRSAYIRQLIYNALRKVYGTRKKFRATDDVVAKHGGTDSVN